jgi:hypothetical protein
MDIMGRVVNISALRVVEIKSDDLPGAIIYADLDELGCFAELELDYLVGADVDPETRRVREFHIIDRSPGLSEAKPRVAYKALATAGSGSDVD